MAVATCPEGQTDPGPHSPCLRGETNRTESRHGHAGGLQARGERSEGCTAAGQASPPV